MCLQQLAVRRVVTVAPIDVRLPEKTRSSMLLKRRRVNPMTAYLALTHKVADVDKYVGSYVPQVMRLYATKRG